MKRKHCNKLNNSSECNLLIVKNISKWHDEQFYMGQGQNKVGHSYQMDESLET